MRLKEIKPGMVIHCNSKKEKRVLFEELKKLGYVWCDNSEINADQDCEVCNNTIHVYSEEQAFSYKNITQGNEKGNVEFSDLIMPELSAEEVLQIRNELSFEFVREYLGLHYGLSLDEMLRKATIAQVMDMCEQWKADHEKKELEFEWADACRIIEVQDNGVKKCVHEEDIKDADLPFGYKECTAEMILKEYMKSHSGNYFAVTEHVCRVKQ